MGDVQDTLNNLIAICRDSEAGFVKAARVVESENLRRRFAVIACQRANFADELAAYLRKMGAEPSAHHRGASRRKNRPHDDAGFVAACENTEENTLRQYEQALAKDLPVPVRPIVDRQRIAVQETLLDLRGLEQVRRAG